MLDPAVSAILTGLSRALGERLLSSPKQKIAIRELQDDVKNLRFSQEQTARELQAAVQVFVHILSAVDGIFTDGRIVKFTPTENVSISAVAVMNLDREVDRLGNPTVYGSPQDFHDLETESTFSRMQDTDNRNTSADPISGLGEEIERLRRE